MTHREAVDFIAPAISKGEQVWADLGAGSGVFARALADLLDTESTVLAVDKSSGVLQIQGIEKGAKIISQQADFTSTIDLPQLDGILMANSLHYVFEKEKLLKHLLTFLKPGGQFLLIEYDKAIPNPWVPYPIRAKQFQKLATKIGLENPTEVNRRLSRYGQGELYAMLARRNN